MQTPFPSITPVGDLYRHGGWVPVLAGMFLLGCGVRRIDDSLDVRKNPDAIFLVVLLFPTLVKNELDWVFAASRHTRNYSNLARRRLANLRKTARLMTLSRTPSYSI